MNMLLLLSFLAAVTCNYAWQLCYPETCEGVQHTCCKYELCDMGSECNKVFAASVTLKERCEIVKTHNKLRAKVASGLETRGNPGPQPRGEIQPLYWDRILADVAQRWANQCKFQHDSCRDVKRFRVGQNIRYTEHTAEIYDSLSEIIENWYDEVVNFDNSSVKSFKPPSDGPMIGHYSQLVWGRTSRVGCGLVRHLTLEKRYRTLLVCNYGENGNWIGKKVYETFKE